jgi:3-oxoacyl-[acyl-carrier-protein] synthase I
MCAMKPWIDMADITAHSMVTSLGFDAATACAAARAGLSRASNIEGLTVTSDVTGQPEPVIVHAVPLLTRGFEGEVRLQRLLFGGLSEVRSRLPDEALSTGPVGFYLSLPDPARVACGLELIPDDESRAVYLEQATDFGPQPSDSSFAYALLAGAAAQAGWPSRIDLRYVSLAGHAGGAQCVACAQRDLDSGRVALAIVGAVDSLLDQDTLAWLRSANRLKLSGIPVGLMPGEACVFLALSVAEEKALGEISRVSLTPEPKTLWSGATSVGEGLAKALEQVAESAGWRQSAPAWIISDQNGETYRANEWGHAIVRLRGAWPALDNPAVWAPAASFGDTGSASSLVAVCTALQALERGYAPAESAVVISSSEAELRAALVITSSHSHSVARRDFNGQP